MSFCSLQHIVYHHTNTLLVLRLGLRLGCEYVDVEACWSQHAQTMLMRERGPSRIIASFHDPEGRITWAEMLLKVQQMGRAPLVDIIKGTELDKEGNILVDCGCLRRFMGYFVVVLCHFSTNFFNFCVILVPISFIFVSF